MSILLAIWKFIQSPVGGLISAAAFMVATGLLFWTFIDGEIRIADLKKDKATAVAERGKAEGERDTANANLGTCRANVLTLNADLSRQNAQVSALQAEGAARAAAYERALREARANGQKARNLSASILSETISDNDLCRAADEFLIRGAG
jgi:hypothetical protein